MVGNDDDPTGDWGDNAAKWTFILTLVLAVLYVGAVVLFIL